MALMHCSMGTVGSNFDGPCLTAKYRKRGQPQMGMLNKFSTSFALVECTFIVPFNIWEVLHTNFCNDQFSPQLVSDLMFRHVVTEGAVVNDSDTDSQTKLEKKTGLYFIAPCDTESCVVVQNRIILCSVWHPLCGAVRGSTF